MSEYARISPDGQAVIETLWFDDPPETLGPHDNGVKPYLLPVIRTADALDAAHALGSPVTTIGATQVTINTPARDLTADELAALKAVKAGEIDAQFAARTYAPITYGANQFETDETARKRVSVAIQLMQAGKLPSPLGWAVYNSTTEVQLTTDDLLNIAATIAGREQNLLADDWTLRAQLNAMTTAAAVAAFDPTSGWS
jgi:hypothetical protein